MNDKKLAKLRVQLRTISVKKSVKSLSLVLRQHSIMERLPLITALVVTLISVVASLVLFLSMFSGKAMLAKISDSSDLYTDIDDTL